VTLDGREQIGRMEVQEASVSEEPAGRMELGVAAKAAKASSTPAEPSDEELELAWKRGSAPAFAVLFERWYRRAYAFAFRRTNGNAALAEEVAQKAFTNLYAKPPPGTTPGTTADGKPRPPFRALLFTVVENELRTEARKRGRRKETAIDVTLESRSNGSQAPDATVAADEEKAEIQAALASLPEEERTVVLLREVEGLSFREVCEATGLTRDMVRGRLAKALERLRRVLKRRAT
jgi:RNA polymerase sigma-70 factor (ECF subfamily)